MPSRQAFLVVLLLAQCWAPEVSSKKHLGSTLVVDPELEAAQPVAESVVEAVAVPAAGNFAEPEGDVQLTSEAAGGVISNVLLAEPAGLSASSTVMDLSTAADAVTDASADTAPSDTPPTEDPTASATIAPALSPIFIPTKYDVVVIGAGLAGLKAAADLHAQGYKVVVLEGRNRTGGRVFSTRMNTSTSTHAVEVGAQWLHGSTTTNNPLYSWVVNTLGISPVVTGDSSSLRQSSSSALVSDADVTAFENR